MVVTADGFDSSDAVVQILSKMNRILLCTPPRHVYFPIIVQLCHL